MNIKRFTLTVVVIVLLLGSCYYTPTANTSQTAKCGPAATIAAVGVMSVRAEGGTPAPTLEQCASPTPRSTSTTVINTPTVVKPSPTTVEVTPTDVDNTPTTAPSDTPAPTETLIPTGTPMPTDTIAPTASLIPTETSTMAVTPTVVESPTPTRVKVTSTPTIEVTSSTTPTVWSPSATPTVVKRPTSTPAPAKKQVAIAECVAEEMVLVDDGFDIYWFPPDLSTSQNVTLGLPGIDVVGSFDPNGACVRMSFIHVPENGSGELWIYDGTYRQIKSGGKAINQVSVQDWGVGGEIAFVSDGWLKTTTTDGYIRDLNLFGVKAIDWSPDGKYIVVNIDNRMKIIDINGTIVLDLPFMGNYPRWDPSGKNICSYYIKDVMCVDVTTTTLRTSSWIGEQQAHDPDGTRLLDVRYSYMMIVPDGTTSKGVYQNPDWFDINRAEADVDIIKGVRATDTTPNNSMAAVCPGYTGHSVVDCLESVGQPYNFTARIALAEKLDISGYTGTAYQNNLMLIYLVNGRAE